MEVAVVPKVFWARGWRFSASLAVCLGEGAPLSLPDVSVEHCAHACEVIQWRVPAVFLSLLDPAKA